MSGFFAFLFSFFGILVAIWAVVKYLLLVEIRIDNNVFKSLYEVSRKELNFILKEEFVFDSYNIYPNVFSSFCFFKKSPPFYLTRDERLFQAGWISKDNTNYIFCFRWDQKKIKSYLNAEVRDRFLSSQGVSVEVALPSGIEKIGCLKRASVPTPAIDKNLWIDIDEEILKVTEGRLQKTSALFYGSPGNGKTSLIKYFAVKHGLPIIIPSFNPDYTNYDVMLLFSNLPNKCIVLFEDFDNYFNKRECIMSGNENKVKFTFDVILNILDGVYSSYENVVFIMTVNDISKVDDALRNRPSRFKHVKHFSNPPHEVIEKIVDDWANFAQGLSLDQIFILKDYKLKGYSFDEAISRLKQNL